MGAAAAVLLLLRRRPDDPAEVERHRRSRLNQVGRIVEGQILEILNAAVSPPPPARRLFRHRASAPPEAPNGTHTLVCYSYSISGVTYEAAQDITGLEERAVLNRLAAGQVTSVKYDPGNPGNSILVAEDWSGLR